MYINTCALLLCVCIYFLVAYRVVYIRDPCGDLVKACNTCKIMPNSIDTVKDWKGFKIVHVNSRSVLQHFDELQTTFLDGCIDVVIFTESWLHSKCADSLIDVKGYSIL